MSDDLRLPHRAVRHLAWRARRLSSMAIDLLRFGDRTVIATPPAGLRFGNWLYLWLNAHARTAEGKLTVVAQSDGMEPWLQAFPGLRPLTISRAELRFADRRKWDASFDQRFGIDFTREALQAFSLEILAPRLAAGDPDELVINIRRGDYYDSPERIRSYGFDQVGYVSAAVDAVSYARHVRIVSDDPRWCQTNLDDVLIRRGRVVEYEPQHAFRNFQSICGARRLIGSNSTFSYWGGYVSAARDAQAEIVMPRFHARLGRTTDAYQLDPDWTIIDGYSTLPPVDGAGDLEVP